MQRIVLMSLLTILFTVTSCAVRNDFSHDVSQTLLQKIKDTDNLRYSSLGIEVRQTASGSSKGKETGARSYVVRLSGVVPSHNDSQAVEKIAGEMPGVVKVENRLLVKATPSAPDSDLIIEQIKQIRTIGPYEIAVHQNADVIELDGVVYSSTDRKMIEEVARSVVGVRTINNNLRFREDMSNAAIQTRAWNALVTQSVATPDNLSLQIQQGKISVSGDRRNHREIDLILTTLFMVPGVTGIDSEMTISGEPYPARVRNE